MAILLTFSRSNWIGIFIGGIVGLILYKRKAILAFILAGLIAFMFLPEVVTDRVFSIFTPRMIHL